jgi:hypothetical protein
MNAIIILQINNRTSELRIYSEYWNYNKLITVKVLIILLH